MDLFIDLALMFFACLHAMSGHSLSSSTLLIVLSAFSLVCFHYVFSQNLIRKLLYAAGLLCGFLIPEFCSFYPFLFYSCFYDKTYLFPALSLLPVLLTLSSKPHLFLPILLFLYALSFILAEKTRRFRLASAQIHTLRDDRVEQKLTLESQHAKLLESQNDKIYIATLKERNRIAREIHDNVGHMLSRSILQVGALLAVTREEPQKTMLTGLKDSLDEAMNRVRASVHDLHNEAIDLPSALSSIVQEYTFCPIIFQCDVSKDLPKEVKYCFISIVNEALNNTIKHSNATQVNLSVRETASAYLLLVEDNGTLPPVLSASEGIGISNMRDRIRQLNGIIHIRTDQGYRIFISVPKQ